jgi:hypothetical protein
MNTGHGDPHQWACSDRGRLVAEGPLLQNQALVAAPGGGTSTSRSNSLGEQTHGGALGLPNGARGASIWRDGEQA